MQPQQVEVIMECPQCRLFNPPTAQFCDCGYDFHGKRPLFRIDSEGLEMIATRI